MQAGDLAVPVQADRVGQGAADGHTGIVVGEHEDVLLAGGVAVEEERRAGPLGLDHRLELARGLEHAPSLKEPPGLVETRAMADLSLGATIAGCRLEAVAGRGGMGVVYRATQLALERPVAVKAIAPQFAEDAAFRERFQRESHLAASIDHPNVIPVYEAGERDGTLYLIMRWVEGTELRALLRSEGRLVAGAGDQAAAAGGLGARRRPPPRPRAPRRQAGQRADRARRRRGRARLPDRLRDRPPAGQRGRRDADRSARRHARLRRAGADRGQARATPPPTSIRSAACSTRRSPGRCPSTARPSSARCTRTCTSRRRRCATWRPRSRPRSTRSSPRRWPRTRRLASPRPASWPTP